MQTITFCVCSLLALPMQHQYCAKERKSLSSNVCRSGEIGRRKGLKILSQQNRKFLLLNASYSLGVT